VSGSESPAGDSSLESALREAASTSFLEHPSGFDSERFELVRELGRGGFGIVYEAIDRGLSDAPVVALKLLRRPHAERLYRFKREFRSLAEVRHENLVPLYELFASGPDVFFTMERIEGRSPIAHVRARPEKARDLLRQLARGLGALHGAGKLHRDIKPSNILVETSGRVVLLDFGLAIDLDVTDTIDCGRAGTPLYMSPEQCAEQPLETASDWYAVGTVLFEALTGRTPFEGTVDELIATKQTTPAPRVRSIAPEVPEDLDELCAALLARDPAMRPNGDEILRRLDAAHALAPTGELRTRREPFVGRERETAELLGHFEKSTRGARTVVLARGPSGIGKSALLRRFLDAVRDRQPETMILAGRCFELESVPYKALDTIVDELARQLRRLPALEAAALLPRDANALATLFPVLRQVEAFAQRWTTPRAPALDASELRARGLGALRELFVRLSDRRPLVVCVDDLQWGDVDSAALLAELIRSPEPPAICWVMTFREEEATTSPLLARITQLRKTTLADVPIHDLRLGGLESAEAEALAATLLDAAREDDPRAHAIAIESQGNPFFVRELVRAGGAEHALGSLVRSRVDQLRGATRRVLDVLAVAGQPLELDVLAMCSDARSELRESLAILRSEHLVRARDGQHEKLLECYHDRIREAVASTIAPGALAAIHLALAAALEAHGSTDAAQIGRHLAEGGAPRKAYGYLTRAAEQAAATLAFEDAAQLYRRAIELVPLIGDASLDPRAAELAYAKVLSSAGHGPEAARLWLSLVDRVEDGSLRIELRRRATEDLLLAGQVEEGFASMNALLAELGLSVPGGPLSAVARMAVNRVEQSVFGLALRSRTQPASERELQRIDTLAGVAWSVVQLEPLTGYALQTQHLKLALRSGDRQRAAIALWLEAPIAAVKGSRGAPYTRRILAAAREMTEGLDESQMPANVLRCVEGIVALLEGRWRDSLLHLKDAEGSPNISVIGHGSLRGSIYAMRAMNLFWMGRSGDFLQNLPAQLRELEDNNNLYGWLWLKLLEAWALSCTGEIDAAWSTSELVSARLPERVFQLHRWYLAFGRAKFLLLEGDPDEAWQQIEDVRRRFRFTLLAQPQRISGWWVRASVALERAARSPAVRAEMLAEARRLTRQIEREDVPWATAIAMTLRASIAQVAGEHAEALRLLGAAEPLLESSHLEAVLAMVRWQRGRQVGGDAGRATRELAESWMAEQRVVPKLRRVLLAGAWED
jgi:tetratricopeptide (TPR) repeat protein